MEEEWHTYWKNPGDSGYATMIDWHLPEGFTVGPLQWPYPHLIRVPPLASYGYEGEIYLLTEITAPSSLHIGQTVTLQAKVNWLACRIECLPGTADVSLTLPVLESPLKDPFLNFDHLREKLSLRQSSWSFEALEGNREILIRWPSSVAEEVMIRNVTFFPEENNIIDHAAQQIFERQDGFYELRLKKSSLKKEEPLERLRGVLVSADGWFKDKPHKAIAMDIPVRPLHLSNPISPSSSSNSMMVAMVFAFIGGLILNLMPCVLPVLSLKILNLVEQASTDSRHSRRHALIFSLGIIVAFLILAVFLLILKSWGKQVGWGFQFQSPFFIMTMSALFLVLGLNLFGVFEIGTSLAQVGTWQRREDNLWNSFFNGILATVVATPCTAPFMGSALGYALFQTPLVALSIFVCLGAGMAFPYWLISFYPGLLKWIPRPGPWMVYLKRVFGVFFFATVIWLSWIFGQLQGSRAVLALYFFLFMIVLACWILGRGAAPTKSQKTRWLARGIVAFLFLTGLVWVGKATIHPKQIPVDDSPKTIYSSKEGIPWEPYSSSLMEKLRNEKRAVFIDFTAAWCLTCQVNERIAFRHPEVIKKFREKQIVAVKADWTHYDEEITEALAGFGKNSIPFYVLYSSDPNVSPIILPEILTPGIVLKALEKQITRKR